ncbi:MAG: tetratricopeptide repeat protein [Alphaproteobacteria bacterium]|nr:MAG: tetratricopeptide repeat protein [Alphaproteobacteria bacterium]
MTEVTFKSKTRFIVLFAAAAIAFGIFYLADPQITSMDEEVAAVQIGQRYLRRHDYDEAVRSLVEAAQKYPQNPDIRYHLGLAYDGLNQHYVAVSQYSLALRYNQYLPGAVYEMGKEYVQSNQMNSAQEMLARLQSTCARGMGCAERDALAAAMAKQRAMQDLEKRN